MRALRLVVCAFLVLLTSAAQALNITYIRDHDEIIESGFLKVAVYEDYPPYSFLKEGEAQGVDVELAGILAAELGLELRLQWMTPDETFDGDLRNHLWKGHYLRPGQVADVMLRAPNDKAFSNMRDDLGLPAHELVHMFGPYQQERWQAAYNPDRIESVPSIAIFQYHPVGVEEDSIPSFYLSTVMNGQISKMTHNYRRLSQAFDAMKEGEVDAVMGTQAEIDWLLAQNPDAGMKLTENAYPNMGMQVWDLGMAVHDSNRQLAYALGDITEAMVLDGRMAELYARFGLRYMRPSFYADL
jgi:polar amino acid transport system substrate-binding protein